MAYPPIDDDPRLTAFALGELDDAERTEVEARLAADPDALQFVDDVRRMAQLFAEEFSKEVSPGLAAPQRQAIEECLSPARRAVGFSWGSLRRYALAASLLVIVGGTAWVARTVSLQSRSRAPVEVALATPDVRSAAPALDSAERSAYARDKVSLDESETLARSQTKRHFAGTVIDRGTLSDAPAAPSAADGFGAMASASSPLSAGAAPTAPQGPGLPGGYGGYGGYGGGGGKSVAAPPDATVRLRSAAGHRAADTRPEAVAAGRPDASRHAIVGKPGAIGGEAGSGPQDAKLKATYEFKAEPQATTLHGGLSTVAQAKEQLGLEAPASELAKLGDRIDGERLGRITRRGLDGLDDAIREKAPARELAEDQQDFNRNKFAPIVENPFVKVTEAPLSTFGIDVDTASYTIVRRSLLDENRPPQKGEVRIEEMVNYFDYDDAPPPPEADRPFAVRVEFARCPWQPDHRLARIGLKGKVVPLDQRPPSNLVFLIDVSGSMRDSNKLPWVKSSLRMLVDKLAENDRVAIVVYAGTRGLALPPTTGDRKDAILAAIDRLEAGGSTNGGAGLTYAYQLAQENFVKGGINRILLCTDGDFNTGDVTDLDGVTRLAEAKRATKVKLTVLGFGQGNLQDAKLEALANKGDGQYAYIDNLKEAHRVLVEQMSGTLQTIAKDVKIQVDFNPRFIAAYRLIGYENRLLRPQDFKDDTKDAGEIGAGHSVTALYELMPPGREANVAVADASKFVEAAKPKDDDAARTQALLVKLAFKPPDGDVSSDFEVPARDDGGDYAAASADFKFAAAVAEFGLLLRDSAWKGQATYDAVLELGGASLGPDPAGRRREFLDLVRRARDLARVGP